MNEPLKLLAKELAHYVGSPCFFNNGKEVLKGEISLLMLHSYEKGSCEFILPILRPVNTMTIDETKEWAKHPFFVNGFRKDCVNKISSDIFNLWLMKMGFDVFGWIDQKKAIDSAKAIELDAYYTIQDFTEFLKSL